MPTVVKLQNGDEIRTDEDPQAVVGRFDIARRDGTLLAVDRPDEDPVWINPHVLSTIQPASESVYEKPGIVSF